MTVWLRAEPQLGSCLAILIAAVCTQLLVWPGTTRAAVLESCRVTSSVLGGDPTVLFWASSQLSLTPQTLPNGSLSPGWPRAVTHGSEACPCVTESIRIL